MGWQEDARPITYTNVGGTITTGGTAQTISCGKGFLRQFYIQNPSDATESLFFEPNDTAIAGQSMEVQPGTSLWFGPGVIFAGNAPTVIAATTAHRFIAYYGQ